MVVSFSAAILVVLALLCKLGQSVCRLENNGHFLKCRSEELTSVPSENLSVYLREIDLSYNDIDKIENGTFATVSELQTLDLSNNKLLYLPPRAFQGLLHLLTLNLSSNPLSFYESTAIFEPLVSLKVIRLQRCFLYSTEVINRLLSHLTTLTTLFVDIPRRFRFESGWKALSRISTSEDETDAPSSRRRSCDWREIDKYAFEPLQNVSIKELQLVQCGIAFIQAGAFEPLRLLEKLDLSYNVELGMREALLSLKGLELLNMTSIKMSMITTLYVDSLFDPGHDMFLRTGDFKYMREICVRSVDLSHNYISHEQNQSDIVQFRLDCLESLNMSYHEFHFFPKALFWNLRRSLKLKTLDFSKRVCGKSTAISATQASPLPKKLFVPYTTLPPYLSWFSVTGCEDWFPRPVQFNFRFSQSLRYFGAAHINLEECWFPPNPASPTKLSHLDISGAKCRVMSDLYFSNLEKVTTLKLSDCPFIAGVLRSHSAPFKFLPALYEVDLSSNKLTDVNQNLFKTNVKLRGVNLANNKIQRLPRALTRLNELRQLDLSFNVISSFRSEEMKQLDSWMLRANDGDTFQLLLVGNPLQCTCDTVPFIRWLYRQKAHLDNVEKYECLLPNQTWVSLKRFKPYFTGFEVECIRHTYLIISVVCILSSVVLISLFTAIYRYRLNLRYWIHTKLRPPEHMFAENQHMYDAFVAYTSDEYEWVIHQLRPKLELENDPVRLCIHERDFIPGRLIHENIVDKMRESRKILLIISPGFLESRYGPLEIEYAGMKCLEERRSDVIICVLMEDIPVRQMPRALRNLWHRITFLKWKADPETQAIFWRNLKAAVTDTEP